MQNHQNNTTGISQLIHANVFFVLTRNVETLHKSAVFISLFDTCTFYEHPLTSTYWWIREYWKGRDLWVTLSFSFYVIVFSVSGWLIQRRKDVMGFLGCSCFLEHHCLLCFLSNFWFKVDIIHLPLCSLQKRWHEILEEGNAKEVSFGLRLYP